MENSNVYGGKFCDPNERQITTLGTGFAANFISGGGAEKAGATLTNKRIYFSGKAYSLDSRGKLSSVKQQKIVNVRDITGAGYAEYKPLRLLILAIVTLIVGLIGLGIDDFLGIGNVLGMGGIISAIGFGVAYYLGIKTLLSIEYAGGNIAFDAKLLAMNEQDNFIRNIHLAKDKLYSTMASDQGFLNNDDDSEPADEIPEL